MFGKKKIIEDLEEIHYDFDSLNFGNYLNRVLVNNIKDNKTRKEVLKHIKRYQKFCKKDVLGRRKTLFENSYNFFNAIQLNGNVNQADVDLCISALEYHDLIDKRFDKELSTNKYSQNDYNANLSMIHSKYLFPNLKAIDNIKKDKPKIVNNNVFKVR